MTDEPQKRVLIVGNPNVGKSLLFSRITGINVISANYPGTTVAVKKRHFLYHHHRFELIDLPGLYSLDTISSVDASTVSLFNEGDIVLNVIDATNLERNLNLTLQLLARKVPMVICLNIWDETIHRGISIDAAELERIIGVPVVTTNAQSGEGINTLVTTLLKARITPFHFDTGDTWSTIGSIINRVQHLSHRHHTVREWISDFTLHPVAGPLIAVVILVATFMLVRFLGESLINSVCDPLYTAYYQPFVRGWTALIPSGVLRELLVGSSSDPLQSFGILTTGVYIAIVLVFPYFFTFYLVLGLLEDFGYLPRLAVVLDTLFHRLGLHGYSSIAIMLGLGCKVPALLATRTLATKREKVLTIALILMCAPCLPQSAMIFSMGMQYGTATVITIFTLLIILSIGMNIALNRLFKGEVPELFIEIPGYRLPSWRFFLGKLWVRIVEYFGEVLPMIVVGVLIIHILDVTGLIIWITTILGRPVAWFLGLPREIASVMILGFLRKDVSIALLSPFHLSAAQFIIASIFMVLYMPCIASFFTLIREVGIATAFKIVAVVFLCAAGAGCTLHLAFNLTQMLF
jgi:ferrous iron transport protein B